MAKTHKGRAGGVTALVAVPIPTGAGRQMPAPQKGGGASLLPGPYTAHPGGPYPGDGEARGVVGMHRAANVTPHGLPQEERARAGGRVADASVPGATRGNGPNGGKGKTMKGC